MAMNIVEINVTGSTVIGGGVNVGAAGSHHDVALRITFDSEWDNLSKKILWQNSRGLNTVYTLLDSDFLAEGETRVYLVPIPSEPKEFAGNMQFSVKGFSETNGSITIAYTASCTFVVSPSVNDSDAREAEETKTAAISEQLQAKVDNLKSGVNNLQTDKVDKVNGKGLSTEDYTTEEKAKLEGIEAGAQVNTVDSVAGRVGEVTLTKGDVGLSNVDNTADTDKPISTAQQVALNTKANASDVTAIQSKIPSQATSDNQLADKDFVNSSISTEIANKVDKETGKGLSTEDYTTADKNKLDGIETGAEVNTVDSVAGKTGTVVLTKGDVGLSNVDNTADIDKPISTKQQTALDGKQDTLVSGTNIKTINGVSILGSGDLRTKGQWEWLGESTNDEVVSGLSIISDQVDLTHKYRYFRIILDVKAQTSENTIPLLPRIKLVNKHGVSQGIVFQSFSSGSANIPKVGAITIFDIDNTSELAVTHMYQQGVYTNSAGNTPHTTWDTIADISGLSNIAGFYIDITDSRYPGFATGCKMTVYGKE